jgi:hypothetical protein
MEREIVGDEKAKGFPLAASREGNWPFDLPEEQSILKGQFTRIRDFESAVKELA